MAKNEIGPAFAVIGPEAHGKRLDAALEALYPHLGLRARRRLWEWCRITLDGREAAPGSLARLGQRLEVDPLRGPLPDASLPWGDIRVIEATAEYCALFKPGGVPSARLSGGGRHSAEEYVLENWRALALPEAPMLCNRLDGPTSGLLLWAFGRRNYERFKALEAQGGVRKQYLALVRGCAPEAMRLDSALGTDGGSKTRVLDEAEPDSTRHTLARRLSVFEYEGSAASLLGIHIQRGARHQIRAHLASAGCPIIGDELYGGGTDTVMYLHHRRIGFTGFAAEIPAPWSFTMPGDEPR